MHFWYCDQSRGGRICDLVFCECFRRRFCLLRRRFCCVNLNSRSWSIWKRNQITPTYLKDHVTHAPGSCPCICEDPGFFIQRRYHRHGLLKFATCVPLLEGPHATSNNLPRRNPRKLFIHDNFFGPSGLLVWSEHERSPPFQPMRELRMHGYGPSVSCVKWP